MKRKIVYYLLISLGMGLGSMVHAKKFYIDPQLGHHMNDGSQESPWRTLQEVFEMNQIETQSYSPLPYSSSSSLIPKNAGAPVQAGDTLMLLTGFHGGIFYRGFYNAQPITIMNAPGHQPSISHMQLSATQQVIIDGLTISPEYAPTFSFKNLFHVESHGYHGPSRNITIKNCTLYGIQDASQWTETEWNQVGSCIRMFGDQMTAINNTCRNINEGVGIFGDSAWVINNEVINFAGDGMRGQGSYLLFEDNLIKNCYDVNGNHDDGFQSFTDPNNPFIGNILRGNIILNYEDPDQPFKGTLQGIGCFDGRYQNWIIENNLIIVNHYHGISLFGADSCRIVNNTVIDIDLQNSPNGTWIMVTDHKDGTPSSDCVIQNNISFGYSYGTETLFSHNLLITNYDDFQFSTPIDFSLLPNSTALDAGSALYAPEKDLLGVNRPQGVAVDMGAFELIACTQENYALNQNVQVNLQEFIAGWFKTVGNLQVHPGTTSHIEFEDYAELNEGLSIQKGATFLLKRGLCNLSN